MISLQNVFVRAGRFMLEDISFELPHAAYGIVIGPAGAGKTTLLETIAGVVRPSSGTISLGGENVTRLPPERRRLGIVYQHAYLFPHLSVRENIEYGANRSTANEMSERFGVTPLLNRPVASLSGGERQLVAIARTLARQPDALLLDEPFSALDPRTRNATRQALRALYAERRFTVLQVTHDFGEAGLLGDLAIVLDRGKVVQKGDPEHIFRKPASPYIADFLGAENVFAGTAQPTESDSGIAFTTGALTFYAIGSVISGSVHAVIRAEEVSLSTEPTASSVQNQFRGTVREVVPNGPLARVTVDASGTPIVAMVTTRSVRELGIDAGKEVVAAFKATAVHLC